MGVIPLAKNPRENSQSRPSPDRNQKLFSYVCYDQRPVFPPHSLAQPNCRYYLFHNIHSRSIKKNRAAFHAKIVHVPVGGVPPDHCGGLVLISLREAGENTKIMLPIIWKVRSEKERLGCWGKGLASSGSLHTPPVFCLEGPSNEAVICSILLQRKESE